MDLSVKELDSSYEVGRLGQTNTVHKSNEKHPGFNYFFPLAGACVCVSASNAVSPYKVKVLIQPKINAR